MPLFILYKFIKNNIVPSECTNMIEMMMFILVGERQRERDEKGVSLARPK